MNYNGQTSASVMLLRTRPSDKVKRVAYHIYKPYHRINHDDKATRDDAISTDLIISTRPDFYQNMISWRAMNEEKREISFILVKELAL